MTKETKTAKARKPGFSARDVAALVAQNSKAKFRGHELGAAQFAHALKAFREEGRKDPRVQKAVLRYIIG